MAEKSVTDILEKLCIGLHIKTMKVETNEKFTVVLQCKLIDGEHSEEQSNKWVSKFSDLTYTNWITKRRFANPTRYIFRKIFSCQHADVNKVVKRRREDCRNRNKQCGATIDFKFKKINRDTIRNDCLLKEGKNVVIHINFSHSHKVHVAQAYSYLRMNNNTVETFNSYFKLGMTPSASKAYHEIKILESEENNILSLLANAQINPTQRQVNHLYDKWRKSEYGGREETSVLQILRSKTGEFEKAGVKVVLRENPLLIVIVTPIMQRTVAEEFSNEIIFIDSSGSCDQSNTCVTFIFTASKIGALPVACILHTAQTESNYALAFSAAKETLEFGGKAFSPQVIMTDDSVAERNALKSIFPTSTLLLCTFHICQAQWRWLWQSNHNVPKEDRRIIMQMFRDVLYSNTPEEAEENFCVLMSSEKIAKNSLVKEHFTKLWERKLEWCITYRRNLLTRGNNTNNFTEASIRIFKDVILQRCKAFNSCALADFIVTTFEHYYKKRLLEFANSRRTKHQIDYKHFCTKAKNIEKILKIEDDVYHVVSATDKSLLYTINTNIAFCDCPQGKSGAFCKHLCALEQQCGFLFRNSPALFYEDKVKLAKIAVGADAPMEFFMNMESEEPSEEPLNILEKVSEETAMYHRKETIPVYNLVDDNHSHHKKAVEEFREEFNRISNIFEENCTPEATAVLIKLNSLLKNVHTPTQALNFAANAFSRSRKIRVQPTSIARRKNRGLPKSNNRIQAGRPTNMEQKSKQVRPTKRIHNLSKNILENKPNAKIH